MAGRKHRRRAPARLYAHGHLALKQCRHGPMLYNVNDTFVGRCLDLYGEWCQAELDLLTPLLPAGGFVVDVGANIGTHTVAFAKAVGETGVVVAFEPQRLVFQMLCANVALNGLTQVHCLHKAAAGERGRVRVPVLRQDVEVNYGALSLEGQEVGEVVEAIPIDDLRLPACHLIKVDVEGMEAKVLQGARATIEAHGPALFVENNTEAGAPELIGAVRGLGYRCWWHVSSYYSPDNFYGNDHNIFAGYRPEVNMLCLPRGAPAVLDERLEVRGPQDTWSQALVRMQR